MKTKGWNDESSKQRKKNHKESAGTTNMKKNQSRNTQKESAQAQIVMNAQTKHKYDYHSPGTEKITQ